MMIMRPTPSATESHMTLDHMRSLSFLRLDDRAGHAEVAHEVGDADDRHDHRDEAEVGWDSRRASTHGRGELDQRLAAEPAHRHEHAAGATCARAWSVGGRAHAVSPGRVVACPFRFPSIGDEPSRAQLRHGGRHRVDGERGPEPGSADDASAEVRRAIARATGLRPPGARTAARGCRVRYASTGGGAWTCPARFARVKRGRRRVVRRSSGRKSCCTNRSSAMTSRPPSEAGAGRRRTARRSPSRCGPVRR